jgi:hypothetical protein
LEKRREELQALLIAEESETVWRRIKHYHDDLTFSSRVDRIV